MNINSRRSRYLEWAAQLILAIAIAGCGGGASPVAIDATALTHDTPKTVQSDRRDEVLRIRVDMLRGRYWVLGLDYVSVYSIANMRLIRRVVLPGWNVARFLCPPDMAVDRLGAALISSNAVPMLWHIDPDNFMVTRHEITLQTKENWDVGFTGLAFAADGALFGVTALAGSLWRIKVNEAGAAKVELSKQVVGACTLRASYRMRPDARNVRLVLCVASKSGLRRIDVSTDFTSGRVSEEPCDGSSEND